MQYSQADVDFMVERAIEKNDRKHRVEGCIEDMREALLEWRDIMVEEGQDRRAYRIYGNSCELMDEMLELVSTDDLERTQVTIIRPRTCGECEG